MVAISVFAGTVFFTLLSARLFCISPYDKSVWRSKWGPVAALLFGAAAAVLAVRGTYWLIAAALGF